MSNIPSPWNPENMYHSRTLPQVQTTKPVTISTLFPNIDRWALGFDEVWETLNNLSNTRATGFPPYNVTKNGDDYTIEMALAGFRKDEVEVVVEDRKLTIRSDIEDRNEKPEEAVSGEVIHHGIAQRNFTTNFALGEYVEVVGAEMADGILTVKLETHIPDEKKPKVIEVK